MSDPASIIEEYGRRVAPDPRAAVFELRLDEEEGGAVLRGATTEAAVIRQLLDRLRELAGPGAGEIREEVLRLGTRAAGASAALVRSAIAPVLAEPRITAPQATQYVLGHRVEVLQRSGSWTRVRGGDGYLGWVHEGYLQAGDEDWARQWERGEGGEPVVSLGAALSDDEGWLFARLPWGARLFRDQPGRLRLPDGRRGTVEDGEVVPADRLRDRFPTRGDSVARTARLWWGVPYLWGGVSTAGADCSGFVQSVYGMHGIALPRDSDLQAGAGVELDPGAGPSFRAGDLLFFAERPGRVTHVAVSLGAWHIVHSSLSNGGVEFNDLAGERALEVRLRGELVAARRVLPEPDDV